jgi:hypothetical protein
VVCGSDAAILADCHISPHKTIDYFLTLLLPFHHAAFGHLRAIDYLMSFPRRHQAFFENCYARTGVPVGSENLKRTESIVKRGSAFGRVTS